MALIVGPSGDKAYDQTRTYSLVFGSNTGQPVPNARRWSDNTLQVKPKDESKVDPQRPSLGQFTFQGFLKEVRHAKAQTYEERMSGDKDAKSLDRVFIVLENEDKVETTFVVDAFDASTGRTNQPVLDLLNRLSAFAELCAQEGEVGDLYRQQEVSFGFYGKENPNNPQRPYSNSVIRIPVSYGPDNRPVYDFSSSIYKEGESAPRPSVKVDGEGNPITDERNRPIMDFSKPKAWFQEKIEFITSTLGPVEHQQPTQTDGAIAQPLDDDGLGDEFIDDGQHAQAPSQGMAG